VIGGIVVGFGEYLLYNTVSKAGANSSRVVREPLLAEAMAARRRDRNLSITLLSGRHSPAARRLSPGPDSTR
jgi:hypothetical protein